MEKLEWINNLFLENLTKFAKKKLLDSLFNEYPVRIMSQAGRLNNPQYDSSSPADYAYTSRNAYIALKKEAIHAIAWRISYMEKHS